MIYDSEVAAGTLFLFRVGIDGARPPERIEVAGLGARDPATVPSLDRLAFAREHWDTDIYGFDHGRSSRRVIGSSFLDFLPEYSPDGHRIAFCSSRSAEGVEVWVAASDGSGEQQLTRGPGRWQCSPHWSPDGRHITFDSDANGGHIWTIDTDGGTSKQLTSGAGRQYVPRWSHDGQWIYYTWQNGHVRDIWRTRASGGPPERVTNGGAAFGLESVDGQSLMYQTREADGPLLAMPLTGGPPREVVKCVRGSGGFFPGSQGIYYVACNPGPDVVYVRHPETGRDELVGRLEAASGGIPYFGLAVSPDGTRILYSKAVNDGTDLMLIENFR